jgi:erythromycin esterase-like protein
MRPRRDDQKLITAIRESAHQLSGDHTDFDPLLRLVGDSSFVLIGEASHGTHEFYRVRAQITKRLIAEKDFSAVAVEADWPAAYRVNQFVRFEGDDDEAVDALSGFQRFPSWMWRNADVLDFVGWLRNYNGHRHRRKVGFYGLDLYSLHASMRAVLDFLDKVDPEAARRARYRYACFENFGEDTQAYGYSASFRPQQELRGRGRRPMARDEAAGRRFGSARWTRGAGRFLFRRTERSAREERRTILPLHVS